MNGLNVQNLCVVADGRRLVDGVSFTLKPGELVAVIGPNGAGKSMLLRGTLGQVEASGSVRLNAEDLRSMSAAHRARQLAYLPQTIAAAWPVRVRDAVALGRFAYGAAPERLTGEDADAVEEALEMCDLLELAERSVDTLSGGETARVHCARAFAARTPFIIADEPVAALDPAQAFRVLELLQDRARDGAGVLVVLHDIALAARFADRMILVKAGRIAAAGPVDEVLNADSLAELFGIRARLQGRDVLIDGRL